MPQLQHSAGPQQPQESFDLFHKLFLGKGDAVGAIAYSIFRQEEDEFIRQQKKGKRSTDIINTQALNSFAKKCDNEQSILRYRQDAQRYLQMFQDMASNELSGKIAQRIATELEPKSWWDRHKGGFFESMAASVCLGLLALLGLLCKVGPSRFMEIFF